MNTGFYRFGREHLIAECERVRLMLRRRMLIDQRAGVLASSLDVLQRGFTSPEVALAAASEPRDLVPEPRIEAVERELFETKQTIARQVERSLSAGIDLRLPRLVRLFGLSTLATSVLLLAVAAEVDGRIRKIYGFLADDITRQNLDVELASRILCESPWEAEALRDELAPEAPLIRHRLLVPPRDAMDDDFSVLRMALRPSRRVVDFLRDKDEVDPVLATSVEVVDVERDPLATLVLPASTLERVESAFEALEELNVSGSPLLAISGPPGTGKSALALAAAWWLNRRAILVHNPEEVASPPRLARLFREARLQDALVVIERLERLDETTLRLIHKEAAAVRWPLVFESRDPLELPSEPRTLLLETSRPSISERIQIWNSALEERGVTQSIAEPMGVKYRVSGGAIVSAASKLRPESRAEVAIEAIEKRLAEQRSTGLGDLARRITRRASWDDLVLPPQTQAELEHLVDFYRFRSKVFLGWGFDRTLTTGRGLSALFDGPPGTGKTLAAGVIARQFDMELFQVDLSSIVSKWLGETEKNLAKIFDEAERAHAVLLFDEADSLFAQRTDVRSSNDRHANMEVNYLLQRMDAFAGITFLTTNFGNSIDEAFARRLSFRITFPFPGPDERASLWEVLTPTEMETEGKQDFGELGRRFALSGGHIRNAILKAAVTAARQDSKVKQEHLVDAALAQCRSLGMLIRDDDPDTTMEN